MNLGEANLTDLTTTYYVESGAATAADELIDFIEAGSTGTLARLLRDHREETVSSPTEIDFRNRTDRLLTCCGILEIAALTGFISEPDDREFWNRLRRILADGFVREYYTSYYPVRLPQLLRARLEGRHARVEQESSEMHAATLQFLTLDQRFITTLGDSCFLAMLDHFTIGGYGFRHVVDLLRDPGTFMEHLLLPPDERNVADAALHEFHAFIHFSHELKNLLDHLDDRPLVQSEVWHHYGYWYGSIGARVRSGLGEALDQFASWDPAGDDESVGESMREELTRAKQVIASLTSSHYAQAADAIDA